MGIRWEWERLTKGTKYEGVKYGPGMPGGAGAFLKFIKEREEMLEGK